MTFPLTHVTSRYLNSVGVTGTGITRKRRVARLFTDRKLSPEVVVRICGDPDIMWTGYFQWLAYACERMVELARGRYPRHREGILLLKALSNPSSGLTVSDSQVELAKLASPHPSEYSRLPLLSIDLILMAASREDYIARRKYTDLALTACALSSPSESEERALQYKTLELTVLGKNL